MNTWNKLITISNDYQKSLVSEVKRQNGIYYTHPDLAYFIMKNMFSTTKLLNNNNTQGIKSKKCTNSNQ